MSSKSATLLVVFVIAVGAFCIASVFAAMTGEINILPNETDLLNSSDNSTDDVSVSDSSADDSGNDYSYSSSSGSSSVHLKVRIQDIIMILQALLNIILTEVLTMIQVEVLLELKRVVQEELLKFYFFLKI